MKTQLQECPCGSKEFPWIENDARGISIGYVCEKCISKKKAQYRPEIFTDANYECDEQTEEED
jgi:hypothetical protein